MTGRIENPSGCCMAAVDSEGHCHQPGCLYLLGLQAGQADYDRLTLNLQARDIAIREAGKLLEQVEAERDRLAETIRRVQLFVDQLNEQGTAKVTAAIIAALLTGP